MGGSENQWLDDMTMTCAIQADDCIIIMLDDFFFNDRHLGMSIQWPNKGGWSVKIFFKPNNITHKCVPTVNALFWFGTKIKELGLG